MSPLLFNYYLRADDCSVDLNEELVESGTVVCGTPAEAVEQIKRCHSELGQGLTNLVMKIGNISDEDIVNQIKVFGKNVFPKVSHL